LVITRSCVAIGRFDFSITAVVLPNISHIIIMTNLWPFLFICSTSIIVVTYIPVVSCVSKSGLAAIAIIDMP
jgi:hypothetical protein